MKRSQTDPSPLQVMSYKSNRHATDAFGRFLVDYRVKLALLAY